MEWIVHGVLQDLTLMDISSTLRMLLIIAVRIVQQIQSPWRKDAQVKQLAFRHLARLNIVRGIKTSFSLATAIQALSATLWLNLEEQQVTTSTTSVLLQEVKPSNITLRTVWVRLQMVTGMLSWSRTRARFPASLNILSVNNLHNTFWLNPTLLGILPKHCAKSYTSWCDSCEEQLHYTCLLRNLG